MLTPEPSPISMPYLLLIVVIYFTAIVLIIKHLTKEDKKKRYEDKNVTRVDIRIPNEIYEDIE